MNSEIVINETVTDIDDSILISLPQGNIAAIQNTHEFNQPPILALHGWLDNAASFVPLIQQLPQFNWTAIDLPGHGRSFHRPEHTHYHFVDWISDIVTLIRQEHQQKVILVGHSLGGMLATLIAGLYPELIDKLVLIDAAGLVTQDKTDGVTQLRQALDSRTKISKKTKSFSLENAISARMNAGVITKKSAQLLVNRNVIQIENAWLWSSDKRLKARSPIRLSEYQAQDIIRNIQAPTLICKAENGEEYMAKNIKKYQSFYANLDIKNVSGGHHCHMDSAPETGRFIHDFLT